MCIIILLFAAFLLGIYRCFSYTNSKTKPEKHKEDWSSKQQQGYGVGIEPYLEDAQQP